MGSYPQYENSLTIQRVKNGFVFPYTWIPKRIVQDNFHFAQERYFDSFVRPGTATPALLASSTIPMLGHASRLEPCRLLMPGCSKVIQHNLVSSMSWTRSFKVRTWMVTSLSGLGLTPTMKLSPTWDRGLKCIQSYSTDIIQRSEFH